MNPAEATQLKEEAMHKAELAKVEPIDFAALEKKMNQWMLLEDTGVIKFLCAVYVANHLHRDPIWVFFIGASGGGKTELLTSLFDLPDMYPISLLTPNTFLSGMPGERDTSLLPKLTGKIMAFLDWTNILSVNRDAKNEIMGQLRDIYGGYMKKPFGNGKIAEWRGKVGIMACTTQVVDFTQQSNAPMGERFIHYRIKMPDRKKAARRSLDNGENMEQMRKEMKQAFFAFFKGLDMNKETPDLSEEVKQELVCVANFASMARSGVIREFSFKKEVVFVPAAEMPTRITQQLDTIAHALMVVNGGVYLAEDMKIIYKIALDSIPESNKMVIREMARRDIQTTKEIATALGYPTAPIHMYLENLALLGVCRRIKGSETEEGGTADRWSMEQEFRHIVQIHEGIKQDDSDIITAQVETAIEIFGGEEVIPKSGEDVDNPMDNIGLALL